VRPSLGGTRRYIETVAVAPQREAGTGNES
jgi:hypothetical protein